MMILWFGIRLVCKGMDIQTYEIDYAEVFVSITKMNTIIYMYRHTCIKIMIDEKKIPILLQTQP